jgi:hypothetical protein
MILQEGSIDTINRLVSLFDARFTNVFALHSLSCANQWFCYQLMIDGQCAAKVGTTIRRATCVARNNGHIATHVILLLLLLLLLSESASESC